MEVLQRTANRGSISTASYDIDNSIKFETANTESLTKSQTASNRRTWTVSFWFKKTKVDSATQYIFEAGSSGSTLLSLFVNGTTDWRIYEYVSGSRNIAFYSTVPLRDSSAWYHIVIACDTTQSDAANRFKIYLNGVNVTAISGYFSTTAYPALNYETQINNSSATLSIGKAPTASTNFCGYISEFNFIDGLMKDEEDFGRFDSASGIWTPIEYTGSYGNEGYFLNFADSGDLGDDESGNGNDFTENNISAADQATDTPTNNFTTWNTIRYYNGGDTVFKEGGTVVDNNFDGGFSAVNNNVRIGKGKWYAEFQVTVSGNVLMNGNVDADYIDNDVNAAFYLGSQSDKTAGAGYYSSGTTGNDYIYYEGTFASSGVTTSTGDIISVAMDCDNNKVHFAVNGTYTNSSNPATNANGFAMTDNEQYFALSAIGVRDYKANFGGYTGISISSAASDENGYGTFEYAPPTGYYALCTKNLAEYG